MIQIQPLFSNSLINSIKFAGIPFKESKFNVFIKQKNTNQLNKRPVEIEMVIEVVAFLPIAKPFHPVRT